MLLIVVVIPACTIRSESELATVSPTDSELELATVSPTEEVEVTTISTEEAISTATIEVPATESVVETPTTVPKGVISEAISTDAISFHPYLTTDRTSRDYQFRVYASGLWQRDPETNLPIPYMASSWDVSDDGKTYTFHLREDMHWSDGVPITADDFVWTYEQAINPENAYPYISILADIVSYTAPDEFTLEVTLKNENCAGILTTGQITPLPKHIWETLPWSDPENNPEIMDPTVVSGAWQLGEWKKDEYAIFAPNETYFEQIPLVDSWTVRIIPDPTIQFQLLQSGEVDYAPVGADNLEAALRSDNLTYYEWGPAQAIWYFIGFNFNRPLLQDIELRHALSYAMPREAIAQTVFNGLAVPTYSTFTPFNWVFNPHVAHYDYDIDEANVILENAGYMLNSDGERLDKEGNPLFLTIHYPTGDTQREQIALIAQEEFSKLGIEVELVSLESQALFEYLQGTPDEWDMWVGLSRDTSDPYFMYQAWSEATIPAVNTGSYINKEIEDLFNQGNLPPCDTATRGEVFKEIQRLISEDSPYIFLVAQQGFAFASDRIEVNPVTPLGVNYRINEWHVVGP